MRNMMDIARALRLRDIGFLPAYDEGIYYECEELKAICQEFKQAKELIEKGQELVEDIDKKLEALAKERGIEIPKDECNDD